MNDIEIIPTEFNSADNVLRGNFVKPMGDGPFPGICKFHGFPGSADQVHGIALTLARVGFLVLTFDFSGFRASEGIFSLSGEIEDAKSAVTHLQNSYWAEKEWLGVYGASFGGAIAICSAVRDTRIKSICVRAPLYDTKRFTDSKLGELVMREIALDAPEEMHGVEDMADQKRVLASVQNDAEKFNPMNEIAMLSPRPIFIITGDADALIDVKGVTRLYQEGREPKELVIVKGADHNLSTDAPRNETEQRVVEWFTVQRKHHPT